MATRLHMHTILAFGAALVATALLTAAPAWAQGGTVSGTISAKGLTTSGDIVVSLTAPGLKTTPPAKPVSIDQRGMKFIPHVLPVVKGTTVSFLNSDPLGHNVFSPEGHYNLGTWPQGETHDHVFAKAGVYTQLCRVHSEMEAFVVVLDTPYYAVTHADGSFEIPHVAPGQYTLVAWSESLKEGRQKITVSEGKPVQVQLTLSK